MAETESFGIKEIAKIANVSIGTVDRVIHNRKGVSKGTRKKVLEIIQQTGYKKNVVASRLKLASRKKIRIASLLPEFINDRSYWKLHWVGAQKAEQELQELGVVVDHYYFKLLRPAIFREKWDAIRQLPYDGIITVPFFEQECKELLDFTHGQHIPVVFLDSEFSLSSSFCIRQNSFEAGMVAGRLLSGLVNQDGRYIIVNYISDKKELQLNHVQRENGFRHFFKQNFPDKPVEIINLNHPLDEEGTLNLPLKKMLNRDTAHGIFVTNARSYLVAELLNGLRSPATYIVGFDLHPKNVVHLRNEKIHFLINQKPEFQSYTAIKGLYKFLTEEDESELAVDIPVEIIVKENVDFYFKE